MGVYVLALALLALVFLIGEERNHAQRWIQLPLGFDLQPSELAKVALVLACARFFAARPREEGWGLRSLMIPAGLFLGPLVLLIFMEPDLGTSLFLSRR